MKKFFTFFAIVFFMATYSSVIAQDTLDVPYSPVPGTFENFLAADTLSDGSRANPNRVYRLERGKVYFLAGQFDVGFNLNLSGAKEPADLRPAVIAPATVPVASQSFVTHANIILDNLYFHNVAPDLTFTAATFLGAGADADYTFTNCVFEGNVWNVLVTYAPIHDITVKDCVFRNSVNPGSEWNGRAISTRNLPVHNFVMINNTFFNLNSNVYNGGTSEVKNFTFSHNTIVNSLKWAIQWHSKTNAIVKDNIFYNSHSLGETDNEAAGQDADGLPFGVFNMFLLDEHDFIDSLGYTEAGRKVDLHNNNWFFSSEITDFWNSLDSVNAEPWMNTRTQGWFDDDANYPNLSELNTTNMDPDFINAGTSASWNTLDSMVLFMRGLRDTTVVKPFFWGFESIDANYDIQWPLPENLAYNNATLKTAGTNGCPLGDLNWFPDMKEQCTPVGTNEPFTSKGLTVEQNMPNPFKGQTTIAYTLADAAKVNVTIIDINGKVITTLLNENQQQGRHTVEWNAGNLATGTYFYQIKTDHALITRKLELVK